MLEAVKLKTGPALMGWLALMLSGCGYQFGVEGPGPTIGKSGPQTPINAPTLAVPNFDNRSSEPNIELKYTNYARQEFAAGSGTRVVTDRADLVLKAQIISVIIPTLTFSVAQTLESRVTVYVGAIIEEVRTGRRIWGDLLTASSEFFVTPDIQFNRVLQTRALEQAGQFMAQDMAARFQNHLETYGVAPPPTGVPEQIILPPGSAPR